jgi:hypothetical protein
MLLMVYLLMTFSIQNLSRFFEKNYQYYLTSMFLIKMYY